MARSKKAEQMITSAEAAEMHGVHPTTWVRWVNQGLAPEPKVRTERLMMFRRGDVEAFNIHDARKAAEVAS